MKQHPEAERVKELAQGPNSDSLAVLLLELPTFCLVTQILQIQKTSPYIWAV